MFEIVTDPKVIAAIAAALIATVAGVYTARKTLRLDQLTLSLNEKQHELDRTKLRAEENHRQALDERERTRSSVNVLYRELSDLRRTASTLLTAIDAAKCPTKPTEDRVYDALHAASELSLYYPPNTPFQEELNQQLGFAAQCIQGDSDQSIRRNLTALRMNIWELVDWYMRRIKVVNGENDEAGSPPKIHKAADMLIS